MAALARYSVSQESVRDNYDKIAAAYAEHLYDELNGKPLDRHLLNRFAEALRGRGVVADIGCGPGQVSRYLSEQGVAITGIDLSPAMVRVASRLNPAIEFRVGDMMSLDLPDGSLAGIVAFYSIIHLEPEALASAFRELGRVLAEAGLLFIAFHVGNEAHHVDDMWGHSVSLDFHFLQPDEVKAALAAAGFVVTESTEREPYEKAEHQSRRCYLLCAKSPFTRVRAHSA